MGEAGADHLGHISIHALREEGDRDVRGVADLQQISIHALREEGDVDEIREGCPCDISIHALREEGDTGADFLLAGNIDFYPRPPRGGRPFERNIKSLLKLFLSTPSARRATPHIEHRGVREAISIHALREEGDQAAAPEAIQPKEFLSTPSARRATVGVLFLPLAGEFLSTPSARRATDNSASFLPGEGFLSTPSARRATIADLGHSVFPREFLSTPSARRATTSASSAESNRTYFYPRPPRGGRPLASASNNCFGIFLSTPSARRATLGGCDGVYYHAISIHALREEGDTRSRWSSGIRPISIHALREEGDEPFIVQITASSLFLSTPSARRATKPPHAWMRQWHHFYPRPPRGGRPCRGPVSSPRRGISIHALREEGDADRVSVLAVLAISIHALREEGDAPRPQHKEVTTYFYPRPPRGGRR